MKKFAVYCGYLALALSGAFAGEGGDGVEVLASARSNAFAVRDVSIKYVTRDSFPIPIEYSSTMWFKRDGQEESTVSIVVSGDTVAMETVFQGSGEGTYEWTPPYEGNYLIEHIRSDGLVLRKSYVFNPPPTVAIEREGQALCKLTSSDGEAPIRYTIDRTQPNSESPLYTGPFPVSLTEFTIVKASTFADGMPPGALASTHFNPIELLSAGASVICAADNQEGARAAGYDPLPIAYDTTWADGGGTSAVLRVDGEIFADGLAGAGDVLWTPQHSGINELSLEILDDDGETVSEMTAEFDAVPRMVAFDGDGGDFLTHYAGLGLWVTNLTITSQAALDDVAPGSQPLGRIFPNLEYLLLGTGVAEISAATLTGFSDLGMLVIPRTLIGSLQQGPGAVARDHVVIGVYDGGKGTISENGGGYHIEARPGERLGEDDFTFTALLDGNIVDTSDAYELNIADGGASASVTLLPPKFGAEQVETPAGADPSDPTHVLLKDGDVALAASPTPSEGESIGALPVEAVPGLYYQAAWGDDLRNLQTGEKVQAADRELYLGVIRQTGDAGFYKVSASESD